MKFLLNKTLDPSKVDQEINLATYHILPMVFTEYPCISFMILFLDEYYAYDVIFLYNPNTCTYRLLHPNRTL